MVRAKDPMHVLARLITLMKAKQIKEMKTRACNMEGTVVK